MVASGIQKSNARVAPTSSAVLVMAEMAQGRLSAAASQPGDMIVLKLKNDLKANGEVLLRKGSNINGLLRTAKSSEVPDRFQSIIEIEWKAPVPQGKAARKLSIALEFLAEANAPVATTRILRTIDPSKMAPASLDTSGRPNAAVLSMPFVVAVDRQTSSTIESRLKSPSTGPIYRIGRGRLTASGSQQTLEIFSHLNNDTVITSANKNFEIPSGVQMRLLVGVNRN